MTEELDSFFRSFLLKWISYEMKERQKNVFYKRMEKTTTTNREREKNMERKLFFSKFFKKLTNPVEPNCLPALTVTVRGSLLCSFQFFLFPISSGRTRALRRCRRLLQESDVLLWRSHRLKKVKTRWIIPFSSSDKGQHPQKYFFFRVSVVPHFSPSHSSLAIQKHRGVRNVKEKCCSDKRYRKKECLILRPIHLSDLPIKRMVGSATLDSDSISIHSYNIIYFAVSSTVSSLSVWGFSIFFLFFFRESQKSESNCTTHFPNLSKAKDTEISIYLHGAMRCGWAWKKDSNKMEAASAFS